jgi:hypothetical protein
MTIVEFGRSLSKLLKTKAAAKILRSYDLEDWGFGGCWILADGLKRAIGRKAALYYVGSPNGVEHVAVRIGEMYLDQDGAQTGARLRSKLGVDDTFLAPFDVRAKKVAVGCGTYWSDQAADDVADLLVKLAQ